MKSQVFTVAASIVGTQNANAVARWLPQHDTSVTSSSRKPKHETQDPRSDAVTLRSPCWLAHTRRCWVASRSVRQLPRWVSRSRSPRTLTSHRPTTAASSYSLAMALRSTAMSIRQGAALRGHTHLCQAGAIHAGSGRTQRAVASQLWRRRQIGQRDHCGSAKAGGCDTCTGPCSARSNCRGTCQGRTRCQSGPHGGDGLPGQMETGAQDVQCKDGCLLLLRQAGDSVASRKGCVPG